MQEKARYNRLIAVIEMTLDTLIKAVQGLVLMSPELEEMYSSLLKNQVPQNWAAVSFSSLKPLASWYQDLHDRIAFRQNWMSKGHPKAYWLSGLFFPHGFITGVLQAHARKHKKAIDYLKFKFDFHYLQPAQEDRKSAQP
jgi:dynein heavy chain